LGKGLPLSEPDPDKRIYEALTPEQTISLKWLVQEIQTTLGVPLNEVFRHPTVSYKNKTEAAAASW